jgi:DNA-binding MarR family transcriptional regulator/N-acetylglutamate synthase-like GNAT family acetyltransferase
MDLLQRAEAVRRFNRFYTRQIGVLHEKLLRSPFSLTEVRVLYELAHRDRPAAGELARDLGLDAGYLSRILRGFETRGLVRRKPSESDARQSLLALTPKGRKTFDPLDAASSEEVRAMLSRLSEEGQNRLVGAMEAIEELLGGGRRERTPYILRTHRPGDMGWVVRSHGVLYAHEHGWNEEFEGVVAEIVAKFIRQFDPRRERCWIAERDGRNAGSVFLVRESDEQARLRLLLVTPEARGLGMGRRLVEECVRFARQAGYRRVTLWTDTLLTAALHIYQQAGFRLVEEKRHHNFGQDLVGQTWQLEL